MLNKYKLVIFDLDGTVVNAYKAIEKSFNYTMLTLGYPKIDSLTIRRAVGWGDENLLRPFIKEKDLDSALQTYRKHHKNSLIRYTYLLPGAKRVLGYLKNKGIKLAIASNRPAAFTKIIIKRLRINKYFNYVLCADRLTNIKPHPEILEKIMRRFSLRPEDTLYVGDMTIDILAGKNAKVKTIAVLTGSSSRKEIEKEKPTLVISDISKLIKALRHHCA